MSQTPAKIRTPLTRVIRELVRRFAPLLFWAGAGVLLLIVSQFRSLEVNAAAIVQTRRVAVTSMIEGVIREITVDEHERVKAGQALVYMDDTMVQAQIKAAEAGIAQLKSELDAARLELQRDNRTDLRRFMSDEEDAELDVLDRITDLEADKASLAALDRLASDYARLAARNVIATQTAEMAAIERDAMKKKIEEGAKALEYARERLVEVKKRRLDFETHLASVDIDNSPLLSPLRDEIRVGEAELAELRTEAEHHVLRAPMDGQIVSFDYKYIAGQTVNYAAGQTVIEGDILMEVVDPKVTLINVWIPESILDDGITTGTEVTLTSRRPPKRSAQGTIIELAPRIQEFPLRLTPYPQKGQYGQKAIVGGVPSDAFLPGELLDAHFSK